MLYIKSIFAIIILYGLISHWSMETYDALLGYVIAAMVLIGWIINPEGGVHYE